jgi:hypothetical protein
MGAMVTISSWIRAPARQNGFGSICKAGTAGCLTYTENDATAIGKKV